MRSMARTIFVVVHKVAGVSDEHPWQPVFDDALIGSSGVGNESRALSTSHKLDVIAASTGDVEDVLLEGMSSAFLECAVAIASEGATAAQCAEAVGLFILNAAVAVIGWLTHPRKIYVGVSPLGPTQQFHRWYAQAHDGVQFGVSDAQPGTGVTVTFHNDGPISGCVAYSQDCGWDLYIAASNPLVGHNKVRVAYFKRDESNGRGCYEVWDDMDSWGESEGWADPNGESQYDNPSWIHYTLGVPPECQLTFKIKHKRGFYLTATGTENGDDVMLEEDNVGHQLWLMAGSGQIYNVAAGRCLDTDGDEKYSRTMISDCIHEGSDQKWKFDNDAFGNFYGFLRSKVSNLCLDPHSPGGVTPPEPTVGQIADCVLPDHQGYQLVMQDVNELRNAITV